METSNGWSIYNSLISKLGKKRQISTLPRTFLTRNGDTKKKKNLGKLTFLFRVNCISFIDLLYKIIVIEKFYTCIRHASPIKPNVFYIIYS